MTNGFNQCIESFQNPFLKWLQGLFAADELQIRIDHIMMEKRPTMNEQICYQCIKHPEAKSSTAQVKQQIYPSIPPKVPKPKATATPVPSPIAPSPVSSLIIKEIPIINPI